MICLNTFYNEKHKIEIESNEKKRMESVVEAAAIQDDLMLNR